jgi:hypothetical protein
MRWEKRRGLDGEGGHACREKTRPTDLGDTVPDAGVRGIGCRRGAHVDWPNVLRFLLRR